MEYTYSVRITIEAVSYKEGRAALRELVNDMPTEIGIGTEITDIKIDCDG